MERDPMGARSAMCVTSSNVLDLVATTSCGPYRRVSPQNMPEATTTGMMSTIHALLGGLTGFQEQKRRAHMIASLPLRLGGHGEVCGANVQLSVLGQWADAMHMVADRLPVVAH